MPKKLRLTVSLGDDSISLDLDNLDSVKESIHALRDSLRSAQATIPLVAASSHISLVDENGVMQGPYEDCAQCPDHPGEVTYLRRKDNSAWWGHHKAGLGWCNADYVEGQPPQKKMPSLQEAAQNLFA